MNKITDSGQEYYNKERENGQMAESKSSVEIKTNGELQQTFEIDNRERRSVQKQNKKSKLNILKALQTFIIGGIAIVTIGTTTLFQKDELVANIGDIKVFDTYAQYVVNVMMTDDAPLKLVIYNDYFKSEHSVLAGETVGIVDGLTPNKSYTIAVKGNFGFGEKTMSKKTFQTLLSEQVLRTSFNGIEMVCTCGVDGKFNFKLMYEDENDYWSDFSAFLETPNGETRVAVCEFSSDTAKWQYFDVSKLDKGGYALTVTVVSSDPKDRENPLKTIYSGEIEI